MTAYAVVPIHTNDEFKLFNDLMRSERFTKRHKEGLQQKFYNLWTLLPLQRNREKFTKIVTSISRQAIVLPAIEFPKKNLGA